MRRLEAHKRTARSFTSKYVVINERDVRLLPHSSLANSSAAGAVLSPADPLVQTKIADYVTAAAYSGMFVRCSRADVSWQQAIRILQSQFSDFGAFYIFINTKEEKRATVTPAAAIAAARAHPNGPPKIPALSNFTFDTAIKELAQLDDVRSVQAKLLCFARCRDVISSVLQHGSMGNSGADDYIPALCWVLLRANPRTLLSNIQFVRVFCDSAQNYKGFVDVCVAVKYLAHLKSQIVAAQPQLLQPPPPTRIPSGGSGTAAAPGVVVIHPTSGTAAPSSQYQLPTAKPVHSVSGNNTSGSAAPLLTTLGTPVNSGAGAGGAAAATPQSVVYTTQAPPQPASAASVRDALVASLKGMGFAENDICKCFVYAPWRLCRISFVLPFCFGDPSL